MFVQNGALKLPLPGPNLQSYLRCRQVPSGLEVVLFRCTPVQLIKEEFGSFPCSIPSRQGRRRDEKQSPLSPLFPHSRQVVGREKPQCCIMHSCQQFNYFKRKSTQWAKVHVSLEGSMCTLGNPRLVLTSSLSSPQSWHSFLAVLKAPFSYHSPNPLSALYVVSWPCNNTWWCLIRMTQCCKNITCAPPNINPAKYTQNPMTGVLEIRFSEAPKLIPRSHLWRYATPPMGNNCESD